MNLGDGLKLETQILGGKTKLLLAPYGVQEKGNKKVSYKSRSQKVVLRAKPTGQILKSVQSDNVKAEPPSLNKQPEIGQAPSAKSPANVLKDLENKRQTPVQNVQHVQQEPLKAKPAPKKPAPAAQRPQQKKNFSAEQLRESLVCLTQEQFQQILQTINQGHQEVSEEPVKDEDQDAVNKETVSDSEDPTKTGDESASTTQTADVQNVRQPGDLFSRLGEREKDPSLQEIKKAQWKRELDEQIALKKQLKASSKDGPSSRQKGRSASEKRPLPEHLKVTRAGEYSTALQANPTPPTVTETDISGPNDVSVPSGRASSFSSPDLPAAIRSSFILGEAAPLDHPFSAIKRQQQKKWLDELNKQREEEIQRRMKEKQRFLEAEEHDRWAMHFDSFKKPADHHPAGRTQPSANLLPSPELAYPSPEEFSPSPLPSYLFQGESGLRKSADEENAQDNKTGFLRTMTALLDPVQIEERERKRIKQIEHQKAIAAQVEEKRKRKQMEEEERKREEREEELRLQKEREQMQRQFEEDSLRQKQKEEIQKMKTNDLYQSMMRAQEEAQRLKQEQRMRDLLQKGHDVSKLQRNTAGDVQTVLSRAVSRVTDFTPEDRGNNMSNCLTQSQSTIISPRRDTGVQTDFSDRGKNTSRVDDTDWRRVQTLSPEIPIEFKAQTKTNGNTKKQRPHKEKGDSHKENKHHDLYEAFARTEKEVKEQRRPDWNRNNPNKKYIPASERYPRALQRHREESKARRQVEMLNLVDKSTVNNVKLKKGNSPVKSPVPREESKVIPPPQDTKGNQVLKKVDDPNQKIDSNFKRPDSPPVPAVKNRLHQAQKRPSVPSTQYIYSGTSEHVKLSNLSPDGSEQESDRPPSSHFIPYVRTKEIYYLDPNAPMSRPSTHDPQYRRTENEQEMRQIFSSDHVRDPLLNPNVVKNKNRQQAILRGLSELRKGLLQKQKELETGLMPDV
uniref:Coiled-coil domain containing 66 n=1 Tax=Leptobrachium leishanense TaxID=445787 RepID=A0A8C5R6Z3_9ANUR